MYNLRNAKKQNARIRSRCSSSSSETSDVSITDLPSPRTRRRRVVHPPRNGLESEERDAPTTIPVADGVVRRIKWSQAVSENVMRAYYGATEGGTKLTAYRSTMLSLFQALEPTTNVTAQRLSDQVRAIQRCHLLDESVLERLRLDIRQVNTGSNSQNMSTTNDNNVSRFQNIIHNQSHQLEDCSIDLSISNQNNEQVRSTLENTILEFKSIPPNLRPQLPRLPVHKHNMMLVGVLDKLLEKHLETSKDLCDTYSILYCGAMTVCRLASIKLPIIGKMTQQMPTIPAWQLRIEKRITLTRTLIAKLICFSAGNNRPRIMRYVKQAYAGMNVNSRDYMACVTERIDFFKQKVYAWAKRIKRYNKRMDRRRQNRMFQSDQRKVYRNWERSEICIPDGMTPTLVEMTRFWRNIWSTPIVHIENEWMNIVKRECESIQKMDPICITKDDVTRAIRMTSNWKCPGSDGLHNFWIKWFCSSHSVLATQFQNAIDSGSLPTFLTSGITFLLHKSGSTSDPKNYRPITCLPTIYKLLTSILSSKITAHVECNNIMSPTQNGCKAGARGTKELLLIDMTICQQVRRSRKNLDAAWIDFKKAYDSVPHTWLMRIMELYKIDTTLCSFLGSCMAQWNTALRHPGGMNFTSSEPIRIQRGIFQGDSLSPLWFCLALNPLSTLLRDLKVGYRLRRAGEVISHLLYMDDLKLFASKRPDLMSLLNVTQNFSNDIGMEFGVDKCAVIHIERGRIVNSEQVNVSDVLTLKCLCEGENYKYLGMLEALGVDNGAVKQSVKERFFVRLKKVLNSLLSGGNKVRAFNGWVMPLLTYTFGILRWTQTELDTLDRKTRKLLTTYRMHHPRSSVMRLYIPRRCGGRGFLNAKNLHNHEVCNLREYFLKVNVDMHRDVVAVDKGFTPLSLGKSDWRRPVVLSTSDRVNVWKSKELHGRFYKALTGPDVDPIASVSWLQYGDLFGETEGFVCAIMDEVIKTKNYRKHIMKDGTVDLCRACHRPGESLRHIVSGCSHLANGEYLHRHNQVARIIHQQLALQYDLLEMEVPYYSYNPTPVLENGRALLYWDRSIITDRYIVANRPDIVLVDRSSCRAMIVDITIPHDDNLIKAEKEKLSKYLDLANEITVMWNLDSTIIVPIVVSVNGLIAKSLDRHLKRLSLDGWIKGRMQKAVLLDTARIVRKFLSLEP